MLELSWASSGKFDGYLDRGDEILSWEVETSFYYRG